MNRIDDLLETLSDHLLAIPRPLEHELAASLRHLIGMKAAGLAIIPTSWTPPFFIVSTSGYKKWLASTEARQALMTKLAEEVVVATVKWPELWRYGILLRSSAVEENLASRGQNETIELPADFHHPAVSHAMFDIYERFQKSDATGSIAVIIQARVPVQIKGHLSNEKRVSITQNRWIYEVENTGEIRSFNSQRHRTHQPDRTRQLTITQPRDRNRLTRFQQVGAWCNTLAHGRAHLEWGATTDSLWLFQLDFEDDLPDGGCRPEDLLRGLDLRPTGDPPKSSSLQTVDLKQRTGWRKIDKVADFIVGRDEPYPRLFWVTADNLAKALNQGEDVRLGLSSIFHGRTICRTDCSSKDIPSLNLPRTETVSEDEALDFMTNTTKELGLKGARKEEICFILHKFIPATGAAWAVAYPGQQIVRVDTLWGLPDGLQFLPHDTFEFDVLRNEISAERIRYKPKFLQETADGSWKVITVNRRFTRHRSISKIDLRQVASETHAICQRIQRPIQIMWFCGIPTELGIGKNVPWFSMPPEAQSSREKPSISPSMPKLTIRSFDDLKIAEDSQKGKWVLHINPEDPELFRSTPFLDKIGEVAQGNNFPVVIVGSILSHAFYMLERKGLTVFAADEPARSRTRQRQIFNKIVRDQIPDQISQHGERAALAVIAQGEARPALAVKLLEEMFELLAAQTPSDVTAELADLLEVVRSLCAATGVDWEQVESFADAKRAKRGSFSKNVVLVETSWPTRADYSGPTTPAKIKLSDLGAIKSDGAAHKVPFSALLAHGGNRVFTLSDGRKLTIAMDGEGISLLEGDKLLDVPRQLEFDLD